MIIVFRRILPIILCPLISIKIFSSALPAEIMELLCLLLGVDKAGTEEGVGGLNSLHWLMSFGVWWMCFRLG